MQSVLISFSMPVYPGAFFKNPITCRLALIVLPDTYNALNIPIVDSRRLIGFPDTLGRALRP